MVTDPPSAASGQDPPAALRRRAAQLQVLTDPVALLVLSFLAQEPDHVLQSGVLAARLHLEDGVLAARLERLTDHDLVEVRDDVVSLTVESWKHFGSIIAPRAVDPEGLPVGVPTGRETDWSGYPTVVRRIADQLAQRFRSTFSQNTVHRYVAESFDELTSRSHVSRHLPMLTNRLATERLSSVAAARGISLRAVPSILFVCVHNAGRSQMAMAWARELAGDLVTVESAGSAPMSSIHAPVLEYLSEVGLEVPRRTPKALTTDLVRAADVIVTMGCGDACPVIPGRRYFDWEVSDPVGRPVEEIRVIAEDIRARVDALLVELGISGDADGGAGSPVGDPGGATDGVVPVRSATGSRGLGRSRGDRPGTRPR